MVSIRSLLTALNERTIAQRIAIPHDEARLRYSLQRNTVRDFNEFRAVLADYCNHHVSTCIAQGGRLSIAEAAGNATEFVERQYRRQNGDINSAFNDAHTGTNGGLRAILDIVAEGLKSESIERYVRHEFAEHVDPVAWDQRVEIMRQFIAQCGDYLSSEIDRAHPERYAHDYNQLIREYVEAMRRMSASVRRI